MGAGLEVAVKVALTGQATNPSGFGAGTDFTQFLAGLKANLSCLHPSGPSY